MSRLDTIGIFSNFISFNNSRNRFFPDITTPCRTRWRPPLVVLKFWLKSLRLFFVYCKIGKTSHVNILFQKDPSPAWVAQWWMCQTHNLVVVSLMPSWGTLPLGPLFSPLTYAEACEKSSWWLWKESCDSTGVRKPGNTCVTNNHDTTLAV